MAGAVTMLIDISHYQEARGRQQLLINEFSHLAKNTLAMVRSITRLSIRSSADLPALRAMNDCCRKSTLRGVD